MDDILNIDTYIADGFVKVCDVILDPNDEQFWKYINIDEDVMYSEHRSWIYFIVDGKEIAKAGETGNPLGIRGKDPTQPITGTMGRLGRYRKMLDRTDMPIRESLQEQVRAGTISIWARKCSMIEIPALIAGQVGVTILSNHKDLEMRYLDIIKERTGSYPRLNKLRK